MIALLPADFVADLDDDLRAELDELAADFGGASALYEAELAAAEAQEDEGASTTPVIEPQDLPESWTAMANG